jgi:hypothetical protein
MSIEQLFSLCNMLALVGWVLLIFAGRARWAAPLVAGVIVPLALGIVYAVLLGAHWGESSGGFSTLASVAALFSNHYLLLAGWVHYLAFDLFIGAWQVRDSKTQGLPHLLVVPGLVVTFLFGPIGLLIYFAIRLVRTRSLVIAS